MRKTDSYLEALLEGSGVWPDDDAVMELIKEVLEARRRGVTGTVDVMAQAEEGDPVAYKDGLYVAGRGLDVVCWCPDEHAQEPPTQVHLVHNLSPAIAKGAKSVIRLKSGVGVDKIIAALYENRLHVWPGYEGVRVTGVVFK